MPWMLFYQIIINNQFDKIVFTSRILETKIRFGGIGHPGLDLREKFSFP